MGEEGKYSPNLGAMDVDHLERAAKAAKNLADRRFAKFEDDIPMIINLQVLSIEDQKTLMNCFVSTSLWPLLELGRGDRMEMMIKK